MACTFKPWKASLNIFSRPAVTEADFHSTSTLQWQIYCIGTIYRSFGSTVLPAHVTSGDCRKVHNNSLVLNFSSFYSLLITSNFVLVVQ